MRRPWSASLYRRWEPWVLGARSAAMAALAAIDGQDLRSGTAMQEEDDEATSVEARVQEGTASDELGADAIDALARSNAVRPRGAS